MKIRAYLEISGHKRYTLDVPAKDIDELLETALLFEVTGTATDLNGKPLPTIVTPIVPPTDAGELTRAALDKVVIVPQSHEQTDAVRSLLPGVESKSARGGTVFSAGRYFSLRYAEAVCDKYIALGLFTATVEP